MSAPEYLTWEGDSEDDVAPRRPSTDDVGGDAKEDDAEFPPDDVVHFTSAGWNQKAKQIPAIAKVAAACKLEVRITAGAPAVSRVSSPSSLVEPATFTPTDEGTGDTSVEWPEDTFPPHVCSPTGLTFLSSSASSVTGHVEEIANGIRVRTFIAGVAADVDWTITIN
jgi:hypothetical protein